jgi:predicted Na+-dependent transporter
MGKFINYGIFVAIAIGVLFPFGGSLKFLIPFLLATILFFSFLKLDLNIKKFVRKELLYYVVFILALIPFLVFVATANLDYDLRLGIFLVSITPTAIGAPIVVDLIKGDRELIVSNVASFNLLSPLTYTLLLAVYFSASNIKIPTILIFTKVATMVFIPLALAAIAKKILRLRTNLTSFFDLTESFAFILVIGIAVSSASIHLREIELLLLLKIFMLIFGLAALYFSIGYLLPKNKYAKKSLAVAFGHKNAALTIWIALSNFSSIVAIPMVIYLICHHIINGFLVSRFSK